MVIVIGTLLMIGAILYAQHHLHAGAGAPPASASITSQESYWMDHIKSEGGVVAYADFGRFVSAMTPEIQHQEAHVFGGALYNVEGVAGLAVCDMQYSFGCFHEFLGRAIARLGLGSISQLNQQCEHALGSSGLSCRHGIGHGILAYMGYSDDALSEAIARCRSVSANDPIGGCDAGVFMEYNLQIMLGSEGKIRAVHNSDMQFPCPNVSAEAKESCYFSQPQWWAQVYMTQGLSDQSDIFERIGKLCDQTPTQYQRNCFEGIGVIAPAEVRFSATQARSLCESASADPKDQLYCRAFAANAVGASDKKAALVLCEGLTQDSYAFCASYAANTSNIALPMETPTIP